ncbi:hypothetical protein GQ53DRAFT_636274 [Thozetella sp. PMI_491]|nr:hypothetical protein GQ53DRAFT_636274 [Thozetella sp. PMI_491]
MSFGAGVTTASFVIFTVLLIGTHLSRPKTASETEAENWNYCGRSSKVAIERGCVMEPSFYGWMPPQCVFAELTASVPIFEDRQYYSDINMTKKLSVDQLYRGEYNTIYTARYHDEHCLFQWRKLQYAIANRVEFIDNKTLSFGHSKHCADQLAESQESQYSRVAEIILGFYRCRKTIW